MRKKEHFGINLYRIDPESGKPSARPVKKMINSWGSLFTLSASNRLRDCDVMALELVFSSKVLGNVLQAKLLLPEGFSFDPTVMRGEKDIPLSEMMEKGTHDEVIYPVYTEKTGPQTFHLLLSSKEGKEEKMAFSPLQIVRHKEEGQVYYRESWTFETVGPHLMAGLSPAGFSEPSTRFNHDLARLSVAFAAGSYTYRAMGLTYGNFGFGHMKRCNYDQQDNNRALNGDEAACAFARKKLPIDGEIKTILAVTIRGSIGSEMLSNFTIESEHGFHKGFSIPIQYMEAQVRAYIEEEGLDPRETKIIMTGHSRGAAIANFLTLRLNVGLSTIGDFAKEDIYTYTFGTPNGVDQKGKPILARQQDNIFNLINDQDVVGHLPGKHYSPGNNLYMNVYAAKDFALYFATFKRRYNAMVVSAKYCGWHGMGNKILPLLDRLPSKVLAKTLGGLITGLTLEDPKAIKTINIVSACLGLGFLGTAAISTGWTGAVCAGILAKEFSGGGKEIADRIYTNHIMETYLCLMEISMPGKDFYVDGSKGNLPEEMIRQGVAKDLRMLKTKKMENQ